jgi:hypothetical protein
MLPLTPQPALPYCPSLAALDAATDNATSWNPDVDNTVYALALAPQYLYAGESFLSIGGEIQPCFAQFATGYVVSGTVTSGGSALPGVTVNLMGAATQSTTTDGNGNYGFSGLSNGAYTITPSKTGYTFTPQSRNVNVNGADITGQNFTAPLGAATLVSPSGTFSTTTPTFTWNAVPNSAWYYLLVYSYAGQGTLAGSGAQVKIYGPTGSLLSTVTAPGSEAGSGAYWLVADVDGATGNVTIINEISTGPPSGSGSLNLETMPSKELPLGRDADAEPGAP